MDVRDDIGKEKRMQYDYKRIIFEEGKTKYELKRKSLTSGISYLYVIINYTIVINLVEFDDT